MKKFFKFIVCIFVLICSMFCFPACNNSDNVEGDDPQNKLKIEYVTFNSQTAGTVTVNYIVTEINYRFSFVFTIENKTGSDVIIYENNLRATIVENDEITNSSISLHDINGEDVETSTEISNGAKLSFIGVISTTINMIDNKERKIKIYYSEEYQFEFVPLING